MATTINANNTDGVVITPDTSGELELQANGVTKAKVTANGLQDANGASLRGGMYRNLIINGDMSIAQRGTSKTGLTSTGYYTIDRYRLGITTIGTFTMSQDTDVPSGQGFVSSLKLACTTADASPAAADNLNIQHRIEAQNLQHLKFGTSSAESLTLSFWVKSNKTGTYTVWVYQQDDDRQICPTFTISSADTWEKKTITIAGDTTGVIDNNNGDGIRIGFFLAAGSNFTSGTLASSWEANVEANRVSSSNVNLADSTSNYINITGVQLEIGEGASDFEFLPYDVQLARCQRYYNRWSGANAPYVGLTTCMATGGTSPVSRRASWSNPVEFRAKPTLGFGGTIQVYTYTLSNKGFVAFNGNTCNKNIISFDFNSSTAGTGGQSLWLIIDSNLATNYIDADAEL